jgi:hypothetical protein
VNEAVKLSVEYPETFDIVVPPSLSLAPASSCMSGRISLMIEKEPIQRVRRATYHVTRGGLTELILESWQH